MISITGKELFEQMQNKKKPSRIPFVPTIYAHAARLIDKTPSQIAQNEDLLVQSQLKGFKKYKHDLISTGVDIYNVECEALGAEINFPNNEELPSLKENLIKTKKDFNKLEMIDPEKDGRMPLFLNGTQRIQDKIGDKVIVNGTVVGPFTLAALLRGFSNYITDLILDTDFALKLLNFAKKVSFKYAQAFIKRGLGISINESWISPPLLSPDLYQKYIFKVEKELITEIKDYGLDKVALISGGDTTSIAPYLVKTGTSLLMADYNSDQSYYKKLCSQNNIYLRASIDSKLLESKNPQKLKQAAQKVINTCADYEKFIFGCGIVSYNTDPQSLLYLKKIVKSMNPRI